MGWEEEGSDGGWAALGLLPGQLWMLQAEGEKGEGLGPYLGHGAHEKVSCDQGGK